MIADFVVVGTGAGGATVARALARHGLDVLMLEEGPDLRARPSEPTARDALRVPRGGAVLVLRVLSAPGQRGILWPVLVALAAILARRERAWRPLPLVGGALATIAVTVLALKTGIGRTAPRSGRGLLDAGGRSYPSGHAVNEIVGLALGAALLQRAGLTWLQQRAVLLTTVIGVVALVGGASLVTADFHWASDVLAGWLLGGALSGVGYALGAVRVRAGRRRTPPAGPSSRS